MLLSLLYIFLPTLSGIQFRKGQEGIFHGNPQFICIPFLFSVNLDSDELSFVAITAWLSGVENGKYVQSINTGRKEEDPILNQYLPSKTAEENGYGAWCDLF